MKKFVNILFATAITAFAVVSCQKENATPVSTEKTVQFIATSIETKTAFTTPEGKNYPVLWTANDTKVKVSLNYATPKDADVTPSGKTASFSVSIDDDGSGKYSFLALSPSSAFKGLSGGTYKSWYVYVPTTQTPLNNSVDEASQILAAKSVESSTIPSTVNLDFSHVTAYGLLSFSNLAFAGSEKVSSVKLTAEDFWVGGWYYYAETGEVESHKTSPEKALTIYTDKSENIWFSCAPVDLSGKKIEIVVTSDAGNNYTRTITIPSGKVFESGKISKFTVDMSSAVKTTADIYTLTPVAGPAGNNNYTTTGDAIDCDGIKWYVTGNSNLTPWRIGGKSITNENRAIYSATAMDGNVKKIVIEHGAASSITVNSMTVSVHSTAADAAAGTNAIASFTPSFVENGTVTVNKADATSWDDCFYRIVYNVTVSGSSNKYVAFKGAVFN